MLKRHTIVNRNRSDRTSPRNVIDAVNSVQHPHVHGSLAVASNPVPGLQRYIDVEAELASGIVVVRLTRYEAQVLAHEYPDMLIQEETFLRLADPWRTMDEVRNERGLAGSWQMTLVVTDVAGRPVRDAKVVVRYPGVSHSSFAMTGRRGEATVSVVRSDVEMWVEPKHSYWSVHLGNLDQATLLRGRVEVVLQSLVLDEGFQWDVRMSGRGDLDLPPSSRPAAVALIDSGCATHPCLPHNTVKHFVESEAYLDLAGRDPRGHGTAMAGIIVGNGDGGHGVRGYAPDARFGVYRAVPLMGDASDIDISLAITQAVEDGAEVICLPLTLPRSSRPPEAVRAALDFAGEMGVTCVLAVGNEGADVGWPAAFNLPNCIAVGAYGRFDVVPPTTTHALAIQEYPSSRGCFLAEFSNVSAEWPQRPDVLAPGVACITTIDGGYGAVQGTSYAAAHVTGMLAVLIELLPEDRLLPEADRPARLRSRLEAIAQPFDWSRSKEGRGQALLR